MKKTKWHPSDVKPVYVGWYECKLHKGRASEFRWWFDGEIWKSGKDGFICNEQNREWRGLAEKP